MYILCYMLLSCHYLKHTKSSSFKKSTAWLENSGGQECLTLGKELVRQKGLDSESLDEEAEGLVKCLKR